MKLKRIDKTKIGQTVYIRTEDRGNLKGEIKEVVGDTLAVYIEEDKLINDFDKQNVWVPDTEGMVPTKEENPNGFHRKYAVTRLDGKPLPDDAEFVVLRVDKGTDPNFRDAALEAIQVFAREIFPHNEQMAVEMLERYPTKESEGKARNYPLIND